MYIAETSGAFTYLRSWTRSYKGAVLLARTALRDTIPRTATMDPREVVFSVVKFDRHSQADGSRQPLTTRGTDRPITAMPTRQTPVATMNATSFRRLRPRRWLACNYERFIDFACWLVIACPAVPLANQSRIIPHETNKFYKVHICKLSTGQKRVHRSQFLEKINSLLSEDELFDFHVGCYKLSHTCVFTYNILWLKKIHRKCRNFFNWIVKQK